MRILPLQVPAPQPESTTAAAPRPQADTPATAAPSAESPRDLPLLRNGSGQEERLPSSTEAATAGPQMGGWSKAGRQSPPRRANSWARPQQQPQQQQHSSAALAAAPSQQEPASLGSAPPQSGTVPRRADSPAADAGGAGAASQAPAMSWEGSDQAGGHRAASGAVDSDDSRRLAADAAPSMRHGDGHADSHAGQRRQRGGAAAAGPTCPEATTAGGGQPGPGMGRQRADTPALDALAGAAPQQPLTAAQCRAAAQRPQRDTAALRTVNEGAAHEVHPAAREGPPRAAGAPGAGASVPLPGDESEYLERPAPARCEAAGHGRASAPAPYPIAASLELLPPPREAAGQAAGPQVASAGADVKSSRRLMADRSPPLGRADSRAQPQQPQLNNDPPTSAPNQAEARPRSVGAFAAAAAAAASAALAVGSTTPLASSSRLWRSAAAAPTPAPPAAAVQARLDAESGAARSAAQAASAAPHQSLLHLPLQQPDEQRGQQLQLQDDGPPQKQMAAPSLRRVPPPPPLHPPPPLPPASEQEQPFQPQGDIPRQDPLKRLRRLISRQLGPPPLTAPSFTRRLERTSQQPPALPPPQPSGQPESHHTTQPPTPYSAQFQPQEPPLERGEPGTEASLQLRQQSLPAPAAAAKMSLTEQSQRYTRQQQALPETPMSVHFQQLQQTPEWQRRLTTPRSQQQQQQQTLHMQHRDPALEHLSSLQQQQRQQEAQSPPQSSALPQQQQEQQQFPQQPRRQQRPSGPQPPRSEPERAQMRDLAVKPRLQQLLLQSAPPPRQQSQPPLQSLQSHPLTAPRLPPAPPQLQRTQQQAQPSPRHQPSPRQPSSPHESAASRSASENEAWACSLSRAASLDKQAAVSRLRESAHRLASAVSGASSPTRSHTSSGAARLPSERASPALRASSDGFSDGERRTLTSFPVDSSGEGESSPELRPTPEVLRPLQLAAMQTDGAANSTAPAALSSSHGRGSLDGARKPRMLSLMKGTPLL